MGEFNGFDRDFATHLDGHVASVYFEGWDYGDLTINSAGRPLNADGVVFNYDDAEGHAQVGLNFVARVVPWARRFTQRERGGRAVKRVIDLMATVQDTGLIDINGAEFGGYRSGDDYTAPPPLRSEEYRVSAAGGQGFGEIPIQKLRPGPFTLLKLGYKVVV